MSAPSTTPSLRNWIDSPTLPQLAAMISNVDPHAIEDLIAVRLKFDGLNGLSVADLNAVRALAIQDRKRVGDPEPARVVDQILGGAPQLDDEWPAPTPLGPPDPDPIPLECLPQTIRNHVESVAGASQTPIDMGALLSLAAIAVTVQGKAEIEIRPGWQEPLNIYTGAVLPPASRKSSVYRHVFGPLEEWEVEQSRKDLPTRQAAEDAREILEKRLEAVKKEAAKGTKPPEAVEAARFQLLDAKVPPVTRLNAPEATPEALIPIMAEQGGRIAILAPEGDPLRIADGRYSGNGDARLDVLKRAWTGRESIRVDRVVRDGHYIRRPALTIAICLQPGVLLSLKNARSFRGEGVLGRFLWVMPESGIGARLTGPHVPALDSEAASEWDALLRRLLGAGPSDGDEDGYVPHTLRLAPDALDVLHRWEAEVEEELGPGRRMFGIPDWGGKLVGNTVRLAGLLHLARTADDPVADLWGERVSRWAMESAIQLARAFSTHALPIFDSLDADPKRALLRYVLRRIKELPSEERNLRRLREVCRGKKEIDTAKDIEDLVGELAKRNLVRIAPTGTAGPGRPESPTVQLHPTLDSHTRNTRNPGSEGQEDVSGINGMSFPDDLGLRGRIEEAAGE